MGFAIKITEKTLGVEIELTAEPEDMPVRGNLTVSDEPDLDRAEEDAVIAELDRGNEWAWCVAHVRVTYQGYKADAYLGGCSYKNEKNFRTDGYFTDMVAECLTELNATFLAIGACELSPHKPQILTCACGYRHSDDSDVR